MDQSYKLGFKAMIPILPSVFLFGLIFGATGNLSGLELVIISSMSIFIFAGSAQFLFLILYINGDPIIGIILASIIINLRHLIYSASISNNLVLPFKKKLLVSYLLTDEAFLVSQLLKKQHGDKIKMENAILGGGGLLWIGWNITTIFGYLIADSISFFQDLPSNFVVSGTFLGFLILQIQKYPEERILIFIIAIAAFVLSFLLEGSILLIIILLIGIFLASFDLFNSNHSIPKESKGANV